MRTRVHNKGKKKKQKKNENKTKNEYKTKYTYTYTLKDITKYYYEVVKELQGEAKSIGPTDHRPNASYIHMSEEESTLKSLPASRDKTSDRPSPSPLNKVLSSSGASTEKEKEKTKQNKISVEYRKKK